MQSENKTKNIIKNAFTTIGFNRVKSDISLWMFYKLEIPSLLLEKDEASINTQNKSIQ